MRFQSKDLAKQLVPKGSVAVDGISLTVVDVDEETFSVALIPHTLSVTTLGIKKVGDSVNLETDIMGKYIWKYLQNLSGSAQSNPLSIDQLQQAGFDHNTTK